MSDRDVKPYDAMGDASPDPLVGDLIPKLAKVPQGVKVVSGWLGKSPEEGRWRLYLTLELDEWIEFPADGVVHHQSLQTGTDPLARTMIWLKNDCAVNHTQPDGPVGQAEFITGEVLPVLARFINALEVFKGMADSSSKRCHYGPKSTSGAGCSTARLCGCL